MNHRQLDSYLREINETEAKQLESKKNINDIPSAPPQREENLPFRMPDSPFFTNGPIHIRKHNRFAPMPLHYHNFIELNYIYSGSCRQWINGQEVVLREGQVCLLDSEVVHSIEAMGDNDILINIIMKKNTFTSSFLSRFGSRGIVSDFLANAITENTNHNRYIVFESEGHGELQWFMRSLMCEAFGSRAYAEEMIYNYIMLVFTELMRVYAVRTNNESQHGAAKADLIQVLDYIEQNFRDCTLTQLSKAFSFNANYLGNMLKKRTGKTFIELVKTQRLIHAAGLLANTDKPIEDIAQAVGYSSLGFFYRIFAEQYGMTPMVYRNGQRQGDPRSDG
ncbi:AraC-like ligand binding domain-containing protein [Paenibacillus catalpae]|uniref:AraC-like ligand binding domain-containing protein n=1 Tax=Paenibacillus catalpae TaxID=1045775 RepID=A0A1I1XLS7_9BACL|nr:helix-turn-helix domain-containing protein [Paenibacillus catalpae]SFE08272.1 AraC-like ligand binding domain-containing protein [Paenibacillus catalpae]